MNSYSWNWNTPYKNLIVTAGEFQKCNLVLEERYAIKFCFKLGKKNMWWKLHLLLWSRDQETEFPEEALPDPNGQTEEIHPQTFDDPFFDSTGMIYMLWAPTGQTVNEE